MDSLDHTLIALMPKAEIQSRSRSASKRRVPMVDPRKRRFPPLLRRSWYGMNQAFRRRIAHLGITPDQYTVLRTLTDAGANGLTQRELTEAMSSDPNTVASLVERMESLELVSREIDSADRRAKRMRTAPLGLEKFLLAREKAIELQAEILGCLPPEEREVFLEQLERVAQACWALA